MLKVGQARVTYWVVAFCAKGDSPSLGELSEWASENGLRLTEDDTTPPWTAQELRLRTWGGVGLWFQGGLSSIELHAYSAQDSSKDFDLWRKEYLDLVADLEPSSQREKVLDHLTHARFIVAMNLPGSELESDALWRAVWTILDRLIEYNSALVYIEELGFYFDPATIFLEAPLLE